MPGAPRSWPPTTAPPGRGPATPPSSGASRWARTWAGPATRWSSTGRISVASGGGLRSQFTHVIDIAPTILDIAGIPAPATVDGIDQQPLHGVAFTDTLTAADAPERHTQQYFESVGNRAMYKDGWWLSMRTARIPWVLTPQAIMPYAPGVWDPDDDPTELYYLPDDFSQAHDLAAAQPDKVAELRELFWQEAERYQVLPLLATLSSFFGQLPPMPATTKLEFRGDVQNVLSGMIPRVYNHSYAISADLVVPDGGVEGVIVAEADHLGGFSLFVEDGKLTHTYSMMGVFIFRQQATRAAADRRGQRAHGVRRRRAEAGHRRPGHALRQRQGRRRRPHGPHRPDALLRLCRHGHRPRQRRRRRPELRREGAVPVHRDRSARSCSTSSRTSSTKKPSCTRPRRTPTSPTR